MNEREMIDALDAALKAAQERDLSTGHAGTYAEAGEWLLALMELEAIGDAPYQADFAETFRAIRTAMGDPPDPFA